MDRTIAEGIEMNTVSARHSQVAHPLDHPRIIGVIAATPIVVVVALLLLRAANLRYEMTQPPFALILVVGMIVWLAFIVVFALTAALVLQEKFWSSAKRGGVTGAIAAAVGWIAIIELIEGLFLINPVGAHQEMGDPEEILRSLVPYLLPVVALIGYILGGMSAIAGWSGRKLWP